MAGSETVIIFNQTHYVFNRKRAAAIPVFYKEYFSRLPDYPKYDVNGDLHLGIYSLIPGSGVLSSNQLQAALQSATDTISLTLGMQAFNNNFI